MRQLPQPDNVKIRYLLASAVQDEKLDQMLREKGVDPSEMRELNRKYLTEAYSHGNDIKQIKEVDKEDGHYAANFAFQRLNQPRENLDEANFLLFRLKVLEPVGLDECPFDFYNDDLVGIYLCCYLLDEKMILEYYCMNYTYRDDYTGVRAPIFEINIYSDNPWLADIDNLKRFGLYLETTDQEGKEIKRPFNLTDLLGTYFGLSEIFTDKFGTREIIRALKLEIPTTESGFLKEIEIPTTESGFLKKIEISSS